MNAETFCEHFATFADAPNAIPKLRELIFQLAVQGKVVSQDTNDEPATVLFSKIQAEREVLIANRAIRRSKPLPIIDTAEVPFEIPATWLWVRFDDVGDWGAGATPNRGRPDYFGGEIKWFKSGELNDAYIDDSEEKITELALKECSLRENQPGDVLVAMYGATIGKVAILNVAATTNQAVCACTCHTGVFNRYLFLMLKAFKPYFISNSSGAAQPNFSKEKIVRTPFPLPPLAEQWRIVEKVDQLLGLCDELAARQAAQREKRQRLVGATLDRLVSTRNPAEFPNQAHRLRNHFNQLFDTPTTIPQLRQTILQLAVQGQLVPQNPDEESQGDEEVPLGKLLSEDSLNGYSKAPSNAPPGVPILRISAGTSRRDFIVDETDYKWVPDAGNIEKFVLQPNDLLACRFNGNLHYVGRFSLYLGTSGQQQINPDKLIRFRVDLTRCDPHYVCFAMNARQTRDKIEAFCATTAGNIGISASNLKTVAIRVPPLAEQKRIVTKVTELLSLCDALEAKLTQTESASTQLLSAAVHQLLNGAATNV